MVLLRICSINAGVRLWSHALSTRDGLPLGVEVSMQEDGMAEILLMKYVSKKRLGQLSTSCQEVEEADVGDGYS